MRQRALTEAPLLPRWATVAAAFTAGLASVACSIGASDPPVAIIDVSVIPMDGGGVRSAMTVVVEGGRVVDIGPATEISLPAGATRVDGEGRFVIPGLQDMHVHFQGEDALARFLAAGVTGVRVLWGSPQTLDFRDRIEGGKLVGPDIYTAGTIIEGVPPADLAAVIDTTGRAIVRDSADGARVVHQQAAEGYDFIKVYNNVPADAYWSVAAEAARLELPVAGHVPFEVGLDGALSVGQASIEHLRGYVWHLVPEDAPQRPGADLRSRTLAWAYGDLSRVEELAERTRDADVWSVPTLAVRMIMKPDSLLDAYLRSEEARHMSDDMRAFYTERRSIPWMSNFTDADFSAAMDGFAVADSLVRALVGVGAGVMAGTDTPPLGFALHRELEELVGAGLTPYQALEAATRSPAEFLGRDELAGMVRVGSPADLVLLDANPLEDIRHIRRIAGVMRRGMWLDRATLDAMLTAAEGR